MDFKLQEQVIRKNDIMDNAVWKKMYKAYKTKGSKGSKHDLGLVQDYEPGKTNDHLTELCKKLCS